MSEEDEAVLKLEQTDAEMRGLLFEIQTEKNARQELVAHMRQIEKSAPPAELERLRYLIGQCDLHIYTADQRFSYLERRGKKEYDEMKQEQRLSPWLKPKKPKM